MTEHIPLVLDTAEMVRLHRPHLFLLPGQLVVSQLHFRTFGHRLGQSIKNLHISQPRPAASHGQGTFQFVPGDLHVAAE